MAVERELGADDVQGLAASLPAGARVAVVHDYLVHRSGQERIVLALMDAFPGARLLTAVYDADRTFPEFAQYDVETSWLDRVPFFKADPRRAMPLLPAVFAGIHLDDVDLVIVSSSGWAHGVRTDAAKLVYCHNTARWLYDEPPHLPGLSFPARVGARAVSPYLRTWDRRAAHTVDTWVAPAPAVAARIREVYAAEAAVLPPPVVLDVDGEREPVEGIEPGFLLTMGRDAERAAVVCEGVVAVAGERLVVVGGLPARQGDEDIWPSRVRGVVEPTDAQLRWLYESCAALISTTDGPGLATVEGQAFGRPAVVLEPDAQGIVDGRTGLTMPELTAEAVATSIRELRELHIDAREIREHADRFDAEGFRDEVVREAARTLAQKRREQRPAGRYSSASARSARRVTRSVLVVAAVLAVLLGRAAADSQSLLLSVATGFAAVVVAATLKVHRHLGHHEDARVPATGSMAGQRVLVVGINYAPEHTGIAPYTTQASEHFAAEGADVLVLAGVPHYPHWRTPWAYRGRLRTVENRNGVIVRRLRHVVPARQSALKRGLYEATFGAHAWAQRLPWKPDVVIGVVPSLVGAAAAARIAKRHDARLVLWVQDLMGPAAAQSGIAGGGKVAKVTGAIEGRVLRQADSVVVLNDNFRRYVEDLGVPSQRIVQQPNWTHVAPAAGDRAATRARLGWGDDETIVLHSGNMGLKQGLENVVEAARLATTDAPHVRFVLMGDGSQREELEVLGEGVANLAFLPPCSTAEFPEVLAAADVLLVNERASAVDMSLPSKLTSYFQAGAPVVAAVPQHGGTAHEVRRSGAGVVVEPEAPRALIEAVAELSASPDTAEWCRAAAAEHVERHLSGGAAVSRLARVLLDDLAVDALEVITDRAHGEDVGRRATAALGDAPSVLRVPEQPLHDRDYVVD